MSEFEKRFPKGEIYRMNLNAEEIRLLKREGWLAALKWAMTIKMSEFEKRFPNIFRRIMEKEIEELEK